MSFVLAPWGPACLLSSKIPLCRRQLASDALQSIIGLGEQEHPYSQVLQILLPAVEDGHASMAG